MAAKKTSQELAGLEAHSPGADGVVKKRTRTFTVVGLQYALSQSGRKLIGKQVPFRVKLKRNPNNEYDSNAIEVVIADIKVSNAQMRMGHLSRQVAGVLAPEMDKGAMKIEKATVVRMSSTTAQVVVKFSLNHAVKLALDKSDHL